MNHPPTHSSTTGILDARECAELAEDMGGWLKRQGVDCNDNKTWVKYVPLFLSIPPTHSLRPFIYHPPTHPPAYELRDCTCTHPSYPRSFTHPPTQTRGLSLEVDHTTHPPTDSSIGRSYNPPTHPPRYDAENMHMSKSILGMMNTGPACFSRSVN